MAEKLTATQKWLKLLDEIASDGSDFSPYEQLLRQDRKVTPGLFVARMAVIRSEIVVPPLVADLDIARAMNITETNFRWAENGYTRLRFARAEGSEYGYGLSPVDAAEVKERDFEAFGRLKTLVMEQASQLTPVPETPAAFEAQPQGQSVAA